MRNEFATEKWIMLKIIKDDNCSDSSFRILGVWLSDDSKSVTYCALSKNIKKSIHLENFSRYWDTDLNIFDCPANGYLDNEYLEMEEIKKTLILGKNERYSVLTKEKALSHKVQ